jgi:hypothetical protein
MKSAYADPGPKSRIVVFDDPGLVTVLRGRPSPAAGESGLLFVH